MLLRKLINNVPRHYQNMEIKGIALDSRKVKKGYIFFAIKGVNSNGENYIKQAITNGAILVFCSSKCKFKSKNVLVIKANDVKKHLSGITSKFYKQKPNNIIAVTGTNGKTSVANFFLQILNFNRIPVASIGTLGIRFNNRLIKTNLTSPDIISLHKCLEFLKKKKINNVIIEASSHGLHQRRLDNLNLKAGIFTNLSQDHLDYHKNMQNYFKAKLILFKKLLSRKSLIITDDTIKEYSTIKKIAFKRKLKLLNINDTLKKIKDIKTTLIGDFQKKNLSMAIIAANACNLNLSKIYKSINKIKSIDGRLELIKKFPNNIKVYVDYAHTPEALKKTLQSLKDYHNQNISVVFGCGGNRDIKKRPIMAKIAKSICEKIYITDDNPREENPKKIRAEITKSLRGSNFYNIGNRAQAIKTAVLNASQDEIILVAGKGHENTQVYRKKIISISDKTIIKKLKFKKKFLNTNKENKHYLFNSKILNIILKDNKFYKFNGLSTDTRQIKKNQLFLAIKGKNNDGNKFIKNALKKGASYIVSSKKSIKRNKKIISVKNISIFLNQFALLKRKMSNAKILAITGSTGKTSLKNMLNHLLNKFEKTYASPKSFNNHYGVPISLSNLKSSHKFGILEIGMSKAGEIEKLSKIVKPHIAIITNVGEAHMENFENQLGIAKAKSEIINNVQKNGTLILNRDDKYFNYFRKKAKMKRLKIVTFSKFKKADIQMLRVKKTKKYKKIFVIFKNKILKLEINNVNAYNVLASLAVLKELNLDPKHIAPVLKKIYPSKGRGRIYNINRYKRNFKLIDESYNASPHSVKNAIQTFSEIKKKNFKKYLILGDMLELGKKSVQYHKEISKLINSSDIDKVFIKGEKSLFTYKNLKDNKRGNIFQCNEDIDLILKNIIANNDYLMIKGSNATGLNTISNAMIKEINAI